MAREAPEIILDLADVLDAVARKVTSMEFRKEALEAHAEPIVKEARRRADRGGGVFPGATGELAKGIHATWSISEPNEIKIGWDWDHYYGMMQERGFVHWRSRRFIKNPHLRPAYNAKRDEGQRAAVDVLNKAIDAADR